MVASLVRMVVPVSQQMLDSFASAELNLLGNFVKLTLIRVPPTLALTVVCAIMLTIHTSVLAWLASVAKDANLADIASPTRATMEVSVKKARLARYVNAMGITESFVSMM